MKRINELELELANTTATLIKLISYLSLELGVDNVHDLISDLKIIKIKDKESK